MPYKKGKHIQLFLKDKKLTAMLRGIKTFSFETFDLLMGLLTTSKKNNVSM